VLSRADDPRRRDLDGDELMKTEFHTIISYTVVGRIKIKELLEQKEFYHECYFIVDEEDDPIMIKDGLNWLRNRRANKKVYVLKFKRESSKFTK